MSKKYIVVLVLRLLETCSSKEKPLTQVKIAELISNKVPCDRKTVGRNIAFLKEAGFPIIKTARGFYMEDQLFTREEIAFILESVKRSSDEKFDTDNLCRRLNSSLSRYYKGGR